MFRSILFLILSISYSNTYGVTDIYIKECGIYEGVALLKCGSTSEDCQLIFRHEALSEVSVTLNEESFLFRFQANNYLNVKVQVHSIKPFPTGKLLQVPRRISSEKSRTFNQQAELPCKTN